MHDIETQRLRLLPANPALAQRYVEFFRINAEHLRPWSPAQSILTYDAGMQRAKLSDSAKRRAEGTHFEFAIVPGHDPEGALAGHITLSNVVRGVFQACYLGYQLSAQAQGNGYMSEAARAVIAFAFERLRLHRIMANYMPANERSARLVQRLGFTVEGSARAYLFLDGAWQDHVLTSLINPGFDWEETEKLS